MLRKTESNNSISPTVGVEVKVQLTKMENKHSCWKNSIYLAATLCYGLKLGTGIGGGRYYHK